MTLSERFHEIRTGFERPFWIANISELFERLSYYAAFASLPRYLHESLNFGVERARSLAGLFGGLVWFLAAFGGALADRMGFRRAIIPAGSGLPAVSRPSRGGRGDAGHAGNLHVAGSQLVVTEAADMQSAIAAALGRR